ncbi:F0F1 ATP synthase subunit epsilon [Clostridium carnis]
MAKTFKLDIITPDKQALTLDVESLKTSTIDGGVEFRANHTDIILSTVPTTTTIVKADGSKQNLFTSSGIIYLKENHLKFCCDSMELPSEIDISRAESAKNRAEKRLNDTKDIDIERAKVALARANARIETISINQ